MSSQPQGQRRDGKPGQGQPLPGVHIRDALNQWAISRVIENLKSCGKPTAIIGDLDLSTMRVSFRVLDKDPDHYMALVVEADTHSGAAFQQIIPWSPVGILEIASQVIQGAGGVIHA